MCLFELNSTIKHISLNRSTMFVPLMVNRLSLCGSERQDLNSFPFRFLKGYMFTYLRFFLVQDAQVKMQ